MAVNVETLDKLERKITLTLPVNAIQSEVDSRLKRLARTVKMDGFRPGKVPMNVVAQRYGYSVHYEVMNDKVGEAFAQAANEAKLRVAGQPKITEKEQCARGRAGVRRRVRGLPRSQDRRPVRRRSREAQRRSDRRRHRQDPGHPAQAAPHLRPAPADAAAQDGDRVTVDFEGKIDGETFQGGKAEDFQFLVGEGQMLKEFEDAVRGMKAGESKTFPLAFPGRLPRQGRGRQDRPTSWSP